MIRLFATGATGQLARSLAERAAGHDRIEVVAHGRPLLDLEEPGSAERALAEFAPDVVLNAAAYTAVDAAEDDEPRAFRINAAAAGEIAAAAAQRGTPVIQISTDYVFDGDATKPYPEDASANPLNVYGRTKLEGERQVRSANPRHTIVRTSWVYSPFGRNFVRTMMNAAETRETLKVVADQWGNPSSALDLAEGLLHMVDSGGAGDGEIYHLAGTGLTNWCEFAAAIMDERRRHGLKVAHVDGISSAEWPTKAHRPRNSALDSGKFARKFGFTMPEWRSSLAGIIERLVRQG
jgi:dTDP-4-dehydrorhamnose reductase